MKILIWPSYNSREIHQILNHKQAKFPKKKEKIRVK